MKLAQILARNIKTLRGEKTQREFARKLGVSPATVARLETAEQNTTLATLDTIVKALKCDINDLLK
ncbi:hypothetical protein MNBD_GAMMA17-1066 [hydrothermal vent metagenome]|uniref:HTH cro/C1-type domain-containing protein n=1 Tax=hydrothermal vent metagenome TaxID=652676 RepID=A0A3B0ZF36_9ZZZZ